MGTVVVYVHGLWLWGGESFLLRRRLGRALGAECRVFSYGSVSSSIEQNAAALGDYLATIRAERLHLVAHSMGGLVVLQLFEQWQRSPERLRSLPPGRIVFAGSPVRGSRNAERLVRWPRGRALLGKSGAVLLDHGERRWNGGRDLGVIAGHRATGLGRLLGPMQGPNDGTVWAQETDLPGATDTVALRVSHSGLLFSAAVARQVAAFLKDGKFRHPPGDEPVEAPFEQAVKTAAAGDFEGAIPLYDRAIVLDPSHAEAYYKRGNAQKNLGRLEDAVASYDRAIELQPDHGYAYCNRGTVLQSLGHLPEALSSYDRAIELNPLDAMSHYNRALLLQECSRWNEALQSYDSALAIDPQFADAQYNRALVLLFLGDFERGWRGYEWRWKNARRLAIGKVREFAKPLWLGEEPIAGKRLLLHSEAGLGDTIQFCRYAPMAAALGATVYIEVQAPLVRVLANLNGVAAAMAQGSPLPEFDYHCPLMSLPLAFKTTLQTIPSARQYLNSDRERVAWMRNNLPHSGRPRVGLVWSGNPNNTIDARRSIRLSEWLPQLPEGVEYFSLQKDVRKEDRAALEATALRPFDSTWDFVDTAALIECLDVVVTVDTSVAHLSAALGQRTWILLPFTPDWRWMRDRDDTPWYPTARLYRQRVAGEWAGVFGQVAADLRRELGV